MPPARKKPPRSEPKAESPLLDRQLRAGLNKSLGEARVKLAEVTGKLNDTTQLANDWARKAQIAQTDAQSLRTELSGALRDLVAVRAQVDGLRQALLEIGSSSRWTLPSTLQGMAQKAVTKHGRRSRG